jgi:diguanylate cyclase (GGDEF)-like protein
MKREGTIKAKIFRRVFVQTAISIMGSIALSLLTMHVIFGSKPEIIMTAAEFRALGVFFSILVPILICPLLAYRSSRLIQDLKIARDRLDILAKTDELTGLLNRRGFDAAAEAALMSARRDEQPIAVLLCDIDHFKRLNDSFGHDFGDKALLCIADVLRTFAKGGNFIVGRQGGDEHVMMLPGIHLNEASAVADSIRTACAKATIAGQVIGAGLSVSIGVAVCPGSQASLSALTRRADVALYDAKRSGRNRVVTADVNEQWPTAA